MAFDFGSDILVDAMRAADSSRAAEAKLKLERLAEKEGPTVSGPEFRTELARLKSGRPTANTQEDVAQKFEAAVLTTFVQAMMPKEASSVFGGGLAGNMWKAQMAEKVAEQISQSGGIGIASRLLKDHQKVGDGIEAIPGLSDPAAALKSTRAVDGAVQFLQKIELESLLKDASDNDGNAIVVNPDRGAVS